MSDAPPRWGRLYERHCPEDTDPASRHVKMIAQGLRMKRSPIRAALADFDPDHMAGSLEATVVALWRARARIRELEGKENG